MKLAEALLIRADQRKKMLSLRERIAQNAMAQEGDSPREDIAKLIAECFAVIAEQQALVLKIDAANAAARASIRPIIRRLFRDLHIVHVRFANPRCGDLHKLRR